MVDQIETQPGKSGNEIMPWKVQYLRILDTLSSIRMNSSTKQTKNSDLFKKWFSIHLKYFFQAIYLIFFNFYKKNILLYDALKILN